jgi:periplasmic divalent cation tolerance protein
MTDSILVLITASSLEEAEKIARSLIQERLAACANILRDVRSVFWWNNAITTEQEVLLMCKSMSAHFPAIVTRVKALHSYQVPEIIALPLIAGSEEYLQWIAEETSLAHP